MSIAVLPIENLSGGPAPLKAMRGSLVEKLRAEGFSVLDDKTLEDFMARHRVRYVGGIDAATANAFKGETKVDAVLITSLEFYNEVFPAKVSVIARLVSAGGAPEILWSGSAGMAGDDSPGILGIGLIRDPAKLRDMVFYRIACSLGESFSARAEKETGIERPGVSESGEDHFSVSAGGGPSDWQRHMPKVSYHFPFMEPGRKYTVAVVPFFNDSSRRNAGEIMLLHFVDELESRGNFAVIEPGLVRQKMLEMRIIMNEGISLADADLIYNSLNADLIMTGKVLDYSDYVSSWGKPIVDFSAMLIEKKSERVVWASRSSNTGNDGVFFFDMGKINTANVLASEMAQSVVKDISRESRE